MTKQLNSVTDAVRPGPGDDPTGGQVPEILKRGVELGRPMLRVVLDLRPAHRAIRAQVSSTVWSMGVPSASFIRYFMSQICSAMGAAKRVMSESISKCLRAD